MSAYGAPVACNSCEHEIALSLNGRQVKAKALDCNHHLCSECFSSRIRILAKDKIMVLKCPVSSCKRITTRTLPAGFCSSAVKPTTRRTTGSNVKMRSKSSVEDWNKQQQKDILLEQFTDVPMESTLSTRTPSVLHTDIEWLIYGIKVLYTVLILAITTGIVLGFETVFSNPAAHMDNAFSSVVLPVLIAVLFVTEFIPEDALIAHRESIKWVKICDLLLISLLSVATCSNVNYGLAHALGQYLSMSLSSHFLILLVASVVVLKSVAIVYAGLFAICTVVDKIYDSIRRSSYMVYIFDLPVTTTPAITTQADSAFYTPKKRTSHNNSTPGRTVRTMGLEYDSRYVCAPLLSIDYPEYSELTDYSELSEQSPLVCQQQKQKHIVNTIHSNKDQQHTSTNTTEANTMELNSTNNFGSTDLFASTYSANDINSSNVVAHPDMSPSDKSETTVDLIAKLSVNMLVEGYPWDEGVTLISNNNTTATANGESSTKQDTPASDITKGSNITASVVPRTCVIYSDVEGVGLEKDNIVNHIVFHSTTAASDSVQVDTTPVEYEEQAEVSDLQHPDTMEHLAEHSTTSDNDIDTAYALNCIYINPYDVELSMENEYIEEETESTLHTYPSPSTYNPIHSTHSVVYEAPLDTRIPEVTVSGGEVGSDDHVNDSPIGNVSLVDTHSLQYSESNNSTPVTPATPTDTDSGSADSTNHNNNTTLLTPFTMPNIPEFVNTVDVYNNPTPVFRVPKHPSPHQDLFVSPVETPVKADDTVHNADTTLSVTSGKSISNPNSVGNNTTITSMYAPVYITPTKSIRHQWQHQLTTTPKTMNIYNSSVLHTPLYAASIVTTPSVESPDDEFRLRSNIKLKPLGRFNFGEATDGTTDNTDSLVDNAPGANGSANKVDGDTHTSHSSNAGKSMHPTTVPASAYYENPISTKQSQDTHANTNTSTSSDSTTTAQATNYHSYTPSYSAVNTVHSMQPQKETSTNNKKNNSSKGSTNKSTLSKDKKGNVTGKARWIGILGPSVNLIR